MKSGTSLVADLISGWRVRVNFRDSNESLLLASWWNRHSGALVLRLLWCLPRVFHMLLSLAEASSPEL